MLIQEKRRSNFEQILPPEPFKTGELGCHFIGMRSEPLLSADCDHFSNPVRTPIFAPFPFFNFIPQPTLSEAVALGLDPHTIKSNDGESILESGRGEAGFDIVPVMSIPDPIAQKSHRNPVLT
jgi:hypothetical protein